MPDTTVKYLHSGMTGAPVMSGTAGSLIAVLDACLVNGFGLVTADSMVIAGNVATINRAAGGLPGEVGSVITVAGSTVSGGVLNGEQKLTAVTGTSVSFATTGIANQTATGTITAKMAPAGWAKTFAGTNLAAYKPTDVTATGCLLRVDDTAAQFSRVVGYEAMSDINTGTAPFPTSTQRSGGSYWSKSGTANTLAKNWMIVSDGKLFYFAREYWAAALGSHELTVFGDFLPTKSGDAFACVMTAMATDTSTGTPAVTNQYWYSDSTNAAEFYCPRSYTGIGTPVQMRRAMPAPFAPSSQWVSGQLANGTPYPNPTDGGLYVTSHHLTESVSLALRGQSPGFYGCPQLVPNGQFAARDSVIGVSGLTGRTLKALTCNTPTFGVAFFDVTGPWR